MMGMKFERENSASTSKRVLIVGCGLTGPLLAMYLTRRGHSVEIFERRADPRRVPTPPGRSINITLAERGLRALAEVGLLERVRSISVPVLGRVIHHVDGSQEWQPYGNHGEALWSVSRADLARLLVAAAEEHPQIRIHFGRRCLGIDLDKPSVTLLTEETGRVETVDADIVVGADGAHSFIRQTMARRAPFRIDLHHASHANKELVIPAGAAAVGDWRREALHIWPRGQRMIISFPNTDGSMTCTLHLPLTGERSFESNCSPAALFELFQSTFPDVLPAIPDLEAQYFSHTEICMVTARCAPWSFGKTVLIGDAAHPIWPSYGQGANAGFEDCRLLDGCLHGLGLGVEDALREFERLRRPDTDVIAQLSEDHFHEIRDRVGDPLFQRRKQIELKVNALYPDHAPLYSLVSFTEMAYREAVESENRLAPLIDQLLLRPEVEHEGLIHAFVADTRTRRAERPQIGRSEG